MASSISVVYANGTTEVLPIRPVALIAAERFYKGKIADHELEATLYAAWWFSHKDDGPFDAWVASLDDFNRVSEVAPRPLDGEASPEESPASQ